MKMLCGHTRSTFFNVYKYAYNIVESVFSSPYLTEYYVTSFFNEKWFAISISCFNWDAFMDDMICGVGYKSEFVYRIMGDPYRNWTPTRWKWSWMEDKVWRFMCWKQVWRRNRNGGSWLALTTRDIIAHRMHITWPSSVSFNCPVNMS